MGTATPGALPGAGAAPVPVAAGLMDMPAVGDVALPAAGLPWPPVRAIVTAAPVPPATRTAAAVATSHQRRRLSLPPPGGPGDAAWPVVAGGGAAPTGGQLAVGA